MRLFAVEGVEGWLRWLDRLCERMKALPNTNSIGGLGRQVALEIWGFLFILPLTRVFLCWIYFATPIVGLE